LIIVSQFLDRGIPMTKTVVIGAGWVTSARHIPALRRSGRSEVIGVVDKHPERARAVAERFSLPHFGASLDEEWVDQAAACTVGVSPMSHFQVASTLLDRGKHVLLEKPMCLAVDEGEILAEKARLNGVTLAIVHNFQFARSASRAKAMLASGRWGRLTGLHAIQLSNPRRRLPSWYEQLPLGLFFDESPHLLYLLKAFGGKVELRSASITPSTTGNATPATVQADFDVSGLTATMSMNFEAPISEWHLMLFTEKGAAVIDLFRDILIFVPNDHSHSAKDVVRSSFSMIMGHAAGFVRSGYRMLANDLPYGNNEVVDRFFDAVEGGGEPVGIDAESALDVLRLQHEIMQVGALRGVHA
jgi:scyllo-inositol 2-dehydrogenase (NADP+)